MPISLNPQSPRLAPTLLDAVHRVSFPTIGHLLESGFLDPAVRTMTPGLRCVGRAVTVRIPSPDVLLLHRVMTDVEPGDVVVVDTGSDRTHAVVGAVIATAAQTAGAAGMVVDGVITDVLELREMALPVFARGTSVLTAKMLGIDAGGINLSVVCGGVTIHPGDVVMADENGVLVLDPQVAADVVDQARRSDEAEPDLLEAVRSGGSLPELSKANDMLAAMGYPAG